MPTKEWAVHSSIIYAVFVVVMLAAWFYTYIKRLLTGEKADNDSFAFFTIGMLIALAIAYVYDGKQSPVIELNKAQWECSLYETTERPVYAGKVWTSIPDSTCVQYTMKQNP